MSVEMGRDAAGPRDSLGSHLIGRGDLDLDMDLLSNRSKSRDPSEHPFGADVDMDFGPDLGGMDLDLGVDFGDHPLTDREKTPGQTRSSRASSPLSEPPPTPPPEEILSPRTVAAEAEAAAKAKKKRHQKEKKQIIDAVTELNDGPGAKVGRGRGAGLGAPMTKDVSNILTEQHFLPRSSIVMRLLEIREDPLAHFLPTKTTVDGTFLCGAPPGMAPALAELFLRPVNNALASKRRGASPEKGANKKARLAHDDEVELPRRQGSVAPSVMGSDIIGRRSIGPDGGFDFGDQTAGIDDFQMDLGGDYEMGADAGRLDLDRARSKSAAPTDRSRLSTPAADGGIPVEEEDETYADATCQIAMFDIRPSTQTQGTEKEAEPIENEGKGYSKNTVKALGIIRKELQPVVDEEDQDKWLSFRKMSDKASRRAAASFFFELLVLGTRDCIQLTQATPFENIEVRAKDKLWERQRHSSLAPSHFGSAAPSRMGSVAPGAPSRIGSIAPSEKLSAPPAGRGSVAPSIASSMGL